MPFVLTMIERVLGTPDVVTHYEILSDGKKIVEHHAVGFTATVSGSVLTIDITSIEDYEDRLSLLVTWNGDRQEQVTLDSNYPVAVQITPENNQRVQISGAGRSNRNLVIRWMDPGTVIKVPKLIFEEVVI